MSKGETYKKWYIKNRIKILKKNSIYHKKNYLLNKDKIKATVLKRKQKNILSWKGYIPSKTNCQCCNKEIYFNQRNCRNAIHFDHKDTNDDIKCNPTNWLERHIRNPENQKLWELCKFGMLCNTCNSFLPTKNREEFIKKIVKYVFGKDFDVKHN